MRRKTQTHAVQKCNRRRRKGVDTYETKERKEIPKRDSEI